MTWKGKHAPRFTPHTAFELPDTDPNAAPRESIETRTLVITESASAPLG